MAIDRHLVLECFLAETEEALGELEEALVGCERGSADPEAMQAIFRHVHTLKGNAASLGFATLATFVHQVEDAFEPLRANTAAVTPDVVSAALAIVDALRQATHSVVSGGAVEGRHLQSVEKLTELNGMVGEQQNVATSNAGGAKLSRSAHVSTLRVPVEKLDRMLDLVGEIGIANARLRVGLSTAGSSAEQSLMALEEIERLYLQLQEHVMDARMVPVGPTFRRYIRTVRDTAANSGKLVDMVIEGEEVGVDTAVAEAIRDPLMHLLRNAVDHGIETPDARLLAGKPERGTITVRASHEAGTILIEIADDGRGLDRTKIYQRALKQGLISEGDRLSAAAAAELVLRPGFSTASAVTETSGRGVGMDVVHRNVLALHGQLEIASEEGQGTTVSIRLPLTLSVLDGFLLRVGSDMFVLPVDAIAECIDAEEITESGCTSTVDVRGSMVPAVRLGKLFGYPDAEQNTAVLVRHNGDMAALIVDELIGSYQAVIKPLSKLFRKVAGVSGSTILGDGRVALVLDVPGLFREALRVEAAVTVH